MREHTWAGHTGHLLIIVAFVASLSALYGYWKSEKDQINTVSWKNLSRNLFAIHSIAAICAIVLLFFMIANHFFEYHYVWKYSSRGMEAKYIFSCFWSGQEGSLLLWSFWIIILAWIVVATSGHMEAKAMTIVLLVQGFLFSMLLGVYIGDLRIGSSPFILIRELPENAGMPWAAMDDYLQQITAFQDGIGLNPLLQNYWMTIHPPVLFLGFAATLIPFALALAGTGEGSNGWVRRTLPWMVFAVTALGAGILLGGAWAYESLSFGGFWAWDPVENASLVPWILLVAGLHCLQITHKRGRGAFLSILFATSPFLLVLYSSFLTRSGILGESSVHSFTENGLFIHLLLFLFVMSGLTLIRILKEKTHQLIFIGGSATLLLAYWISGNVAITLSMWMLLVLTLLITAYEKQNAANAETFHVSSREFWMTAGVLFMIVSAIQITISTSVPVINRIFGTKLDAFTELTSRNEFYHTWQIPLLVMICLLMGATQLMKYRRTDLSGIWMRWRNWIIGPILIGILLTIYLNYAGTHEWRAVFLLIALVSAIGLNAGWLRRMWRETSSASGNALAHIGFLLLILGALVSGTRKEVISRNRGSFSLAELNDGFHNNENVLLRQGDTVFMNNYFVSYRGRNKNGINLSYDIDYFHPKTQNNLLVPGEFAFNLRPTVQLNEQFGNVSEPGTKHFLTHDVFTHIRYADMEPTHLRDGYASDGFMGETGFPIAMGDTLQLENYTFSFDDIFLVDDPSEKKSLGYLAEDLVVKTKIRVRNNDSRTKEEIQIEPLFIVRDSVSIVPHEFYSESLDAKIRIIELSPQSNTIILGLRQREFVVMQAVVFPGMNLIWTGSLLMLFGCVLSLRRYLVSVNRGTKAVHEPVRSK